MSKRSRQQGELESLVLETLWNSKTPVTSHEILLTLGSKSGVALTTLLTVLSRLQDKNLVEREPGEGRSHRYKATQTKAQHTADLMLDLVGESGNPAMAFSHFAKGLSNAQLKALRKSIES